PYTTPFRSRLAAGEHERSAIRKAGQGRRTARENVLSPEEQPLAARVRLGPQSQLPIVLRDHEELARPGPQTDGFCRAEVERAERRRLRRATIAAARTASRRAARRGSIARGAASAARCLATRASALRFTSSIERAAAGQLQTGASSAAHDERQQEAGGTERPCRA